MNLTDLINLCVYIGALIPVFCNSLMNSLKKCNDYTLNQWLADIATTSSINM